MKVVVSIVIDDVPNNLKRKPIADLAAKAVKEKFLEEHQTKVRIESSKTTLFTIKTIPD